MKVASTALLILAFSCLGLAQKMTDRDLARRKGRVKMVQLWSQKIGLDGKPTEEAKTDSETIYDEEGNVTQSTLFDVGQLRTKYFLFEGKRFSKSEFIGEDPTAKMKLPGDFIPARNKNKGPFDHTYKYKYDKSGRIVEIIGQAVEGSTTSSDKYVYDDSGRIESETELNLNGGIEITRSFKYDDSGNLIETVSKSSLHTLNGFEKDTSTHRYSDYAFDKNGNWTKCTATVLNKKGKVESVTLQVRYLTYY